MMMTALAVATVPIAATSHAVIIIICRYCTHNCVSFEYEVSHIFTEQLCAPF
jgi:hypothetical protein